MRLRLVTPILSILVCLLAAELVLELRHYLKGYHTLLLGQRSPAAAEPGTAVEKRFGPSPGFPFHSLIVPEDRTVEGVRIWVASASHAIYGAPVDLAFPNQICRQIGTSAEPCEVINGSDPGAAIEGNLAMLREFGERYQPDYVVLYQMTQSIGALIRKHLGAEAAGDGGGSNSLIDFSAAHEVFERTSAYGHLREYVSGAVALQSQLADRLPSPARQEFEAQMLAFIDAVDRLGATPVLTTFAASYDLSNLAAMPFRTRLWLMLYQQSLSAQGWVHAVADLNGLIRDIARERDVPLIDLAGDIGGQPELFTDFVHFNPAGHGEVAVAIAAAMLTALEEDPDNLEPRHGI